MCSYTTRLLIILAAVTAVAMPHTYASASIKEKVQRLLEITSQGYSRFELDPEGNIVEFHTEGIQFDYMGYRFRAFEMRYNRATNEVQARGDITIEMDAATLHCDQAILNNDKGELLLTGNVTGSTLEPELAFETGAIRIHFPPGVEDPQVEDVIVYLDGGVAVTDLSGNELKTDGVTFVGKERKLYAPAEVELDCSLDGYAMAGEQAGLESERTKLTGSMLVGILRQDNSVDQIEVFDFNARQAGVGISAPSLMLTNIAPIGKADLQLQVRLLGPMVRGWIEREGRRLELVAGEAVIDRMEDGSTRLEMTDNVQVDNAGNLIEAEEMIVQFAANGEWTVSMPEGIISYFNLSEFLEIEPVQIADLGEMLER